MSLLFVILIILACVILGFIVLIQNPKGGGLSGSFGGMGNQFMGVKQTNDVLEKGTWIFATIIGVLSLLATFFISGNNTTNVDGRLQDIGTNPIQQKTPASAPPINGGLQPVPLQKTAPLPTDSVK